MKKKKNDIRTFNLNKNIFNYELTNCELKNTSFEKGKQKWIFFLIADAHFKDQVLGKKFTI